MLVTQVFITEPGKSRRLMNTITPTTGFRDAELRACDLMKPEGQAKCARLLVRGWQMNGPNPQATYMARQTEDGVFLDSLLVVREYDWTEVSVSQSAIF